MGKRVYHLREFSKVERLNSEHLGVHARNLIEWCSV